MLTFRERLVWASVSLLLAISCIILYIDNSDAKQELIETRNGYEIEIAGLLDTNGRLEGKISSCDSCYRIDRPQRTMNYLKRKGLVNGCSDLIDDLRRHPELIPFEGVLGGTFGFYDPEGISVLNHWLVLAYCEDGHIGGEVLLEYSILPDTTIEWRVLKSR